MENTDKITSEQADAIAKELDDFVKGTKIEEIQNYPSNNGVLERPAVEKPLEGEYKEMQVELDPNTGEQKVIGAAKHTKSFEDIVEEINSGKTHVSDMGNITTHDVSEYAKDTEFIFKWLTDSGEHGIDEDKIKKLLDIANRKIAGEKFNIYKELPEEMQSGVDLYVSENGMGLDATQLRTFRNGICDNLINDFILNIKQEKAKHDFAQELSVIYNSDKELSPDEYRKIAEDTMDDSDKKQKMMEILDAIDEAKNLTKLKEFAKKTKIRSIDLEKPNRVFDRFLNKYRNSSNNIYDIHMGLTVLSRHLEGYSNDMVRAFFILFCKQVQNYDIDVSTNHAYIYYVIYNAIMLDQSKDSIFLSNVKEVIYNAVERNAILRGKPEK